MVSIYNFLKKSVLVAKSRAYRLGPGFRAQGLGFQVWELGYRASG